MTRTLIILLSLQAGVLISICGTDAGTPPVSPATVSPSTPPPVHTTTSAMAFTDLEQIVTEKITSDIATTIVLVEEDATTAPATNGPVAPTRSAPVTSAPNDTSTATTRNGRTETSMAGSTTQIGDATVADMTTLGAERTTANGGTRRPATSPSKPTGIQTKPTTASTPRGTPKITKVTKAASTVTTNGGPDKNPVHSHKTTSVIIGLVVAAVVVVLVLGTFIYWRQRRLRNSYGRLHEETEDSGWSAFSKNPIYRGDRNEPYL